MLLDTCFLIDLQRELHRRAEGKAAAFLKQARGPFSISLITWMEFMEGYGDDSRTAAHAFLQPYPLLLPDQETAWHCSRILRHAHALGTPVGDHDAWIGACALQKNLPLVTRNLNHFRAIPGISLMPY